MVYDLDCLGQTSSCRVRLWHTNRSREPGNNHRIVKCQKLPVDLVLKDGNDGNLNLFCFDETNMKTEISVLVRAFHLAMKASPHFFD